MTAIRNKRAKLDYEIIRKFECGIVLNGSAVRAIRDRGGSISQAHVRIISGEIFLINAKFGNETSPSYKLLLARREIDYIDTQIKSKKLTLIPLSLYTRGRFFKLEIALARSRKKYQKKEILKRRDVEREIARELKN